MTTVMVVLEATSCCACGIEFGVPKTLLNALRLNKKDFYCPNGHPLAFGESAIDRAEKAAKRAQELLEAERAKNKVLYERIDHKDRQISAKAGQITKIKNRVAAGVCPCCNRTFQNLANHMKGQHPDFTKKPDSE